MIFAAPIFKALKNYFLWFFMITLQWTGPNNGNITLAPNTSRIVNKNTILDFYTFLSNLKVLKCNYAKPRAKSREIHLLVIKGNWLSGAAGAARSWLSYWTSVRS